MPNTPQYGSVRSHTVTAAHIDAHNFRVIPLHQLYCARVDDVGVQHGVGEFSICLLLRTRSFLRLWLVDIVRSEQCERHGDGP